MESKPVEPDFDTSFDVVIKDRQTWDENNVNEATNAFMQYTCGSKLESKSAFGT